MDNGNLLHCRYPTFCSIVCFICRRIQIRWGDALIEASTFENILTSLSTGRFIIERAYPASNVRVERQMENKKNAHVNLRKYSTIHVDFHLIRV